MAESGQRFYEEDEAEQILKMAASMSSLSSISRDRLIATAAELGISPEAVEEAERRYRAESTAAAERQEFEAHSRRDFFTHLVTFVLVCPFLLFLNMKTGASWWIWVVGPWGFGLVMHAATIWLHLGNREEEFQKWRFRKAKKAGQPAVLIDSTDHVVDRYVSKLLRQNEDPEYEAAVRYVRKQAGLTKAAAEDAVENYCRRNPGAIPDKH